MAKPAHYHDDHEFIESAARLVWKIALVAV
jgi:hypothetical protein